MITMLVKQVVLAPIDFIQGTLIFIPQRVMQENSSIHSMRLTRICSLKRMVLMVPNSAIRIKNLLILKPEVMLQDLLIQTLNGRQLLLIQCSKLKNF